VDPAATAILSAPAKLTLRLRVTGRRADGYHLLDSEMVTVDLADTLQVSAGDELEVVGLDGAGEGALDAIAAGDDNLVRRALAEVGRKAHVRLEKRIPPGAGLGGGSADAAAILRWAGHSDPLLAVRLGADVPFCVVGGLARVQGVGEKVLPMAYEQIARRVFTLLTPPLAVSTRAVYEAWDDLGGPMGPGPNDLEAAALAVEPRLAAFRDQLGATTGQQPVLAGSGSTWFVEGAYPGENRVVVRPVEPFSTTTANN
jgi:4-diphosphocytidyl-2-C-methyl-D-erythritol kinase